MARVPSLSDALELLCSLRTRGAVDAGSLLLETDSAAALQLPDIEGVRIHDAKDLARSLANVERPPLVIIAQRLTAALARALLATPPAVFMLTGEASETVHGRMESLANAGISVLGPHASLHPGDGDRVLCASNAHELAGLMRVCPSFRLAVSPTPTDLLSWLETPALADALPIGYVHFAALDADWTSWLRAREHRHALVPLGVVPASLTPAHPSLEAVASAHELERLTGPVFPAPRVLRLLIDPPGRDAPPSRDDLALWQQARRALPLTGGAAGMATPDESVDFSVPTAAFLAQRARLRRATAVQVLADAHDGSPTSPHLDLDRAHQVLTAAGARLSEHESKVVLRSAGIACSRQAVANSASGAVQFADRLGYPVVMKVVSPDLRRKREAGLVVLDLPNAAAVRRAYARLQDAIEQRAADARVDGVLVAEQSPPGLDLRCGMVRSPSGAPIFFGHRHSAGLYSEPALSRGPLRPHDATLLAHTVLRGGPDAAYRRASDPSVWALAAFFRHLQGLLDHTGDRLVAVEVAPLRVLETDLGVVALDAHIEQEPHFDGR